MPTVNTDVSGRLDFIVRRGDTFSQYMDFSVDDVAEDLSVYDLKMQIRDETGTIVKDFDGTNLMLSNGDGSVVPNRLQMYLPAEFTATLAAKRYVYDFQVSDSEETHTRLAGNFTVVEDVTQ